MTVHHHLRGDPPTDPTRVWCECANGGALGSRWYPTDGRVAWVAWESASLERARTGVLSTRFKALADHQAIGGHDVVSTAGMMLVLLSHTHHRGQLLPTDDKVWDAALFAVALNGPLDGALLVLEHAHTRTWK